MLSFLDIIGVIVLAGPLFMVLVSLVCLGMKAGISDLRKRAAGDEGGCWGWQSPDWVSGC